MKKPLAFLLAATTLGCGFSLSRPYTADEIGDNMLIAQQYHHRVYEAVTYDPDAQEQAKQDAGKLLKRMTDEGAPTCDVQVFRLEDVEYTFPQITPHMVASLLIQFSNDQYPEGHELPLERRIAFETTAVQELHKFYFPAMRGEQAANELWCWSAATLFAAHKPPKYESGR